MNTIQLENQAFVNNTSETEIKYIGLSDIIVNLSTVPRYKLDAKHAEALVEQLEGKERFRESAEFTDPPITVFEWEGKHHLVEGWHRLEAYKIYFKKQQPEDSEEVGSEIPVRVITGTSWIDYYKAIAVANVGQRPQLGESNADKRKRIQLALQHPEIRSLSANAAANLLGVSDKTITKIKDTMEIAEDGTVSFEEKSNVLSFPKQKRGEVKGFERTETEPEGDREDSASEFRSQDDYYEEDHGGYQEDSSPVSLAPSKINDVRPEAERVQGRIEQLEQENQQLKRELELLTVTREERDHYKQAMESIQDSQTPLLQELYKAQEERDQYKDQLEQIGDVSKLVQDLATLKAENEQLKATATTAPSKTSEEKPHPSESQIMREMAQGCKLLALRGGSSSVAAKIEELIESNFNSEFLQAVLEISESEKIKEIEAERDNLIQRLNEEKAISLQYKDQDFLIEKDNQEIARLNSNLSIKDKEIKGLKKALEEKDINPKLIKLAQEAQDMGGWEKIKKDITAIATLKIQNEKMSKLLKNIVEAAQWTEHDKQAAYEGSLEPLEKLGKGMPKDPNKAISMFIENGTGFNRMMEKCFKFLKGIPLLVQFQEKSGKILDVLAGGLILEGGVQVPWKGIYNGYAQFEIMAF